MIFLAIYDASNTYEWLQLREQPLHMSDFHQQKIKLDTISCEYICKSCSGTHHAARN